MSRFDEDDDTQPKTIQQASEQREYGWSWARQPQPEEQQAHAEPPAPRKHLVARGCMLVLGGVSLVAVAAVTAALTAAFGQSGLIVGSGLCAVTLYVLCR